MGVARQHRGRSLHGPEVLLELHISEGADGAPDRAAIAGVLPEMQKQVDLLDKAVAKTGHLAGSGFTLADINLMPILYYIQRFPKGSGMVQSAKHLSAYFACHSERPSFKATIPPPFPTR